MNCGALANYFSRKILSNSSNKKTWESGPKFKSLKIKSFFVWYENTLWDFVAFKTRALSSKWCGFYADMQLKRIVFWLRWCNLEFLQFLFSIWTQTCQTLISEAYGIGGVCSEEFIIFNLIKYLEIELSRNFLLNMEQ